MIVSFQCVGLETKVLLVFGLKVLTLILGTEVLSCLSTKTAGKPDAPHTTVSAAHFVLGSTLSK